MQPQRPHEGGHQAADAKLRRHKPCEPHEDSYITLSRSLTDAATREGAAWMFTRAHLTWMAVHVSGYGNTFNTCLL